MAELTVALRARNVASYIAAAIKSVLAQNDVDIDLIVIDDGSSDGTAACVRSWWDRRSTLITNDRPRGTGVCYNLALERCRSDFIAILDGDGIVLAGALRALLDACRGGSRIGMTHCLSFEIDRDGKSTRDRFRAQRAVYKKRFTKKMDYRKCLVRDGDVIGRLRVYPTRVFEALGRFSESTLVDANYDMALRIADRFEIKLVPEYLYCRRVLGQQRKQSRTQRLTLWARRALHCHRLARTKSVGFLANQRNMRKLLALGLCDAVDFAAIKKAISDRLLGLFWKLYVPIVTKLYDAIIDHLASRPIHLSPNEPTNPAVPTRRIAYYTWHFPVLSQTFINRELAAIKQSGMAVEVIADESEALELADDNATLLLADTHYLEPIDATRLRRYRRHFFWRNPIGYVKCFFFVVSRRYGSYKTIHADVALFSHAVYLAGTLLDHKSDHVHSPWSDRCAFVAMLAAQLAGITYSVQARAHDIHRTSYLLAFAEKFGPARFIVTNTRYNETYMRGILDRAHWSKLFVIHNGIDLPRFNPQVSARTSESVKILTVARLIEQKGLLCLLRACATLRDKGYSFECEIVGGTEDIYMNYYLEVKKLCRQLGLERWVRFSGSVPFKKVLDRYGQADIFTLPCVIAADGSRDITPNALIEAMAMELPVISTTVTGVPEIVEDGVSGILVAPDDDQALADALIKLIDNPDLRKRLGTQARRRVEEKFDINKNVTEYIRLFLGRNGIAEGHPAPGPAPMLAADLAQLGVGVKAATGDSLRDR